VIVEIVTIGAGAISSSWSSGDRHVAEQAIIFVVNTSCEEQSVGVRTARTIAKADPPEALGIGSLEAAVRTRTLPPVSVTAFEIQRLAFRP